MSSVPDPAPDAGVSRRSMLAWSGGSAAAGLAAGAAAMAGLRHQDAHDRAATSAGSTAPGSATPTPDAVTGLPLGLADAVPAFVHMLALDLGATARRTPASARSAAAGFLREVHVLASHPSDAPDPRAQGVAALDLQAAHLQVTPGLGHSLLRATGLTARAPEGFAELPRFASDHLDPRRSGGDLVVQVAADDALRVSATVQQVLDAARRHGLVLRWSRTGFNATPTAEKQAGTTGRNLMGHRDGSANPTIGSPLWDATVRVRTPGWLRDGSIMVVRQITIDLDRWFARDQRARDAVIGRRTSDGAPLGGSDEADRADLSARTAAGELVIPRTAHMRLANATSTGGARIYRRPWNFDDGFDQQGRRLAGQLFVAWQADVRRGFIPIQQSLERGDDALSGFIRHIGSGVFAMPTVGTSDYPAQELLEG